MAIQNAIFLIGREQGDESLFLVIEHERVVCEAIAVVVHISTQKEEGSVFGIFHEFVPLWGITCRISP